MIGKVIKIEQLKSHVLGVGSLVNRGKKPSFVVLGRIFYRVTCSP